VNDEDEQRFNEIDDLYEQIADLCNGKDMAGTVTCLSMLWIQGVHVMGLSKRQALMAVTDFINDVYPEEGSNNGNRTIQ
jgi:hypothetical protein